MQEALRRRQCFVEGVIKCYPDETLETIIDRIVDAEVNEPHSSRCLRVFWVLLVQLQTALPHLSVLEHNKADIIWGVDQ